MTQRTLSVPEVPVPSLPAAAVLYDASAAGDVTYDVAGGVSIWVVVTGDITVTPVRGGADVVLTAVPAYTLLPFRVSDVKAATTADLLVIY